MFEVPCERLETFDGWLERWEKAAGVKATAGDVVDRLYRFYMADRSVDSVIQEDAA